jgi:hypothetical protein
MKGYTIIHRTGKKSVDLDTSYRHNQGAIAITFFSSSSKAARPLLITLFSAGSE